MSIQLKRSFTSNINQSYVLKQGQIGIEMPQAGNTSASPFRMKIGDGTATWANLPYFGESSSSGGGGKPSQVELIDHVLPTNCYVNGWMFDNDYSIGSYQDSFHAGVFFKSSNQGINLVVYPSKCSVSDTTQVQGGGLIVMNNRLIPYGDNISLGDSYCKWKQIYATSGTIQTSDRKSKTNIRYLSDAESSLVSDSNVSQDEIVSLSDVVEFVYNLNPTTFDYNYDGETCPTANRQLGLIADDIQDVKLFPWIGVKDKDEDGYLLGLKPIPLAVAALTVCKYLLQRLDTLEEQLSA